jgi:hypothetical protein
MTDTVAAKWVRAIYADYDANAPDTCDLLLVTDEKLAKEVCDKLNTMEGKGHFLAHNEGHEWCKTWTYHAKLVAANTGDEIYSSMEEVEALFREMQDN